MSQYCSHAGPPDIDVPSLLMFDFSSDVAFRGVKVTTAFAELALPLNNLVEDAAVSAGLE